jgi:hypothetical protein
MELPNTKISITNPRFYNAALLYYQSQKAEALAGLELYFNKGVAIGEHPFLLTEIKKYTDMLTLAEDAIESLMKNFEVVKQ